MQLRLSVSREVAGELALSLGDSLPMSLGDTRISWWTVRGIEISPEGPHRMFVVIESTEGS